jgi:hypothetical protein
MRYAATVLILIDVATILLLGRMFLASALRTVNFPIYPLTVALFSATSLTEETILTDGLESGVLDPWIFFHKKESN